MQGQAKQEEAATATATSTATAAAEAASARCSTDATGHSMTSNVLRNSVRNLTAKMRILSIPICVFFILHQCGLNFVDAKPITFQMDDSFQKVSIKKNENLEVSCLNGNPEGVLCKWEKDGEGRRRLQDNVSKVTNGCLLLVAMADVDEHDGNWTCHLYNSGDSGATNVSQTKVIEVTVLSRPIGPSILVDSKEKKHGSYVPVSPTSSIMCRVIYGSPAAELRFQVDGVDIAGHTEIIEYDSTRAQSTDLYLTQHFDSSWYGKPLRCISRHPAYVTETMDTYVYLQRNVSSTTSAFTKEPDDVQVNEGDSVTFECVTQRPFTSCLWEKDGWTVPNSWNFNYVMNNSHYCAIQIKKATNFIKDEMWRCLVGNSTAVEISREAKLTVIVKPLGPLISVDGLLQLNASEVLIDVHRHPRIQCHSGSGKPASQLEMYLEGRQLKVTHEVSKRGFIFASKLTTESTLAEPIDSTWLDKTLTCTASHPSFGVNQTRSTYVTIREDDRMNGVLFEKEPQDVLVSENETNVTLDCVTTEPIDSCYWEMDGDRISSSLTFKYNKSSQDCSATMYRISFYMNDGYYKCGFVRNLVSSESKMVKVSVVVPPTAPLIKLKSRQLKNDSDVVLHRGKVELTCESSFGYPASGLEWRLSGEPVEGRYEIHKYFWSKKETAYLLLTADVTDAWYGKYLQCVATHQLFEGDDHKVVASIRIRSPITNVKACFDSGMLDFDSESDNSPATMYCLSHDNPLVRYRWEQRNNQSDAWKTFSETQNVTVTGVSGEFSCIVTNKFEAVRSKSILSISNAPKYAMIFTNHDSFKTIEVQHNETVKMSCHSEAYPAPKYRWEHRAIATPQEYEPWRNFSFSQSLGFEGIMGQFACVAYNRLGLARSPSITVLIPHAVSMVRAFSEDGDEMASTSTSTDWSVDGNATFHCIADGSPPPLYRWETRLTDSDPWTPVSQESSQELTVRRNTVAQYSCVAWNEITDEKVRSSEILTIAGPPTASAQTYKSNWILIVVGTALLILLVVVAVITIYARRRKERWNVVASVRKAFGGEIVSERIRMTEEDDDDENVTFETSSLAPLN